MSLFEFSDIFLAMLLNEDHQLIEVSLVGQPLHHVCIKHIRQAGVPDGEDLLFDRLSHRRSPPCKGLRRMRLTGRSRCPMRP